MKVGSMQITEQTKTYLALYISLAALLISIVVNIMVVTRWGTQIESAVEYHATLSAHPESRARMDLVYERFSDLRSDIRLLRSDTNAIKFKLGLIDYGEYRDTQKEIEEPSRDSR